MAQYLVEYCPCTYITRGLLLHVWKLMNTFINDGVQVWVCKLQAAEITEWMSKHRLIRYLPRCAAADDSMSATSANS